MTDQELKDNLNELTPCQSGKVNEQCQDNNLLCVLGTDACGHSGNTPDSISDIATAIDARTLDDLTDIQEKTGFIFLGK